MICDVFVLLSRRNKFVKNPQFIWNILMKKWIFETSHIIFTTKFKYTFKYLAFKKAFETDMKTKINIKITYYIIITY